MTRESNKNKWTRETALSHLYRWCSAQDRCHSEVRYKLIEHQIYGDDLEDIISHLISEGFLNEERFARSFVRGKYRMKKWGRRKILQELKRKQISDYCIKKGMKEIDEEEYYENMMHLIQRKASTVKVKNKFDFSKKISAYMLQKGYAFDEFSEELKSMYND